MICGFVTGVLVVIASNLIHTPDTPNPMTELMEGRASVILMACFGVTLGPLFEELGFRGFLQPLLVRSFGAVAGILLTALPFGLLHWQEYGNSWRHVLVISAAGAAFGFMRHATGSTGRRSSCTPRTMRCFLRLSKEGTPSRMVETIQWVDDAVVMIDQTRLPLEEKFVTCRTYGEVAAAIRDMVIRGAPAIGVAAAMGVALGVLRAGERTWTPTWRPFATRWRAPGPRRSTCSGPSIACSGSTRRCAGGPSPRSGGG